DANSKAVNPFYNSTINLQPNHTLLNETGTAVATVGVDIDSTLRSANPDMGAKEFTPCANDAGVNEFWGLSNPLPVGNNTVRVVLQNQGSNALTSTTIQWQVNGVTQTPFVWTGSLGVQQNTVVTIGSYSFPAGSTFQLKAWTVGANGTSDCNNYNDTARVFDLGTPLCGVYTIGGVNPDFTTFYDASVALNNAGVGCPVVFKVRNGFYNEQIKLYQIPGSSAVNTILFEGENGDSSLAQLHYQISNPSNDYTLALTGTDYISFRKMGIRRTNGTENLIIQNGSHFVTVENCTLGNVSSPNTSCDSILTFRFNNASGANFSLLQSTSPVATNITVENNILNDLSITNSSIVSFKNNTMGSISANTGSFINVENNFLINISIVKNLNVNVKNNRRNTTTTSYADDFTINESRNILVENNRMRRLYLTQDTLTTVLSNTLFENSGCCNDIRGILLNACLSASVSGNTITQYNWRTPRGLDILNSKNILATNNIIDCRTSRDWAMGIYIEGNSTKNVRISNNTITAANVTAYGIYMDAGDSIIIKNNILNGVNFNHSGYGIRCYNILNTLEFDSNTISNFLNEGIRSRPTTNSNWKIRYNTITNVRDVGMFLEGTGSAQYIGNRITGVTAGTGIVVNGPNALVANNYIQSQGLGIAKGISLRTSGTGSTIVFNSVNITGTDIINGQALEVLGGLNYTIKNNIFANNGGGYAAFVTAPVSTFNLDYNDYFSTKRRIVYFQNTTYDTLSVFASLTGKDANSKTVNPFYISSTNLQPNHTLLNETGTAVATVGVDIDSTLRSTNPDIGAKEFTPCADDAGVNEFWGLSNPLPVGNNTVRVVLQNQGSNPLTSTTIQWQVNGVTQTPFAWTGSLGVQQNTVITIGSYSFPAGSTFQLKAWTVGANGTSD
ncbi:MAG: right-handed parallel beta-helix repeat-containing protein, partial [Bacteroidota bacterium]